MNLKTLIFLCATSFVLISFASCSYIEDSFLSLFRGIKGVILLIVGIALTFLILYLLWLLFLGIIYVLTSIPSEVWLAILFIACFFCFLAFADKCQTTKTENPSNNYWDNSPPTPIQPTPRQPNYRYEEVQVVCKSCAGFGSNVFGDICTKCNGYGIITETRKIEY